MTLIFVLAWVLLILAMISAAAFGAFLDTGDSDAFSALIGVVLFTAGALFLFNLSTTVERDCYHAGGDVVNTQCVVIGEKLLLNDEAEDR